MPSPNQRRDSQEADLFPPTAWTQLRLLRGNSGEAAVALNDFCRLYWEPVRRFLVALGCSPEEAADLTQDFFASLLRGQGLERVHPLKGRLRTWLKEGARHHLFSYWRKRRAEKRGGGQPDAPLLLATEVPAENGQVADWQYDLAWAETVLSQALEGLTADYAARGKSALFTKLKPGLLRPGGLENYADLAKSLGVPESQVRLAMFRCRQRLAAKVREFVRQTTDEQDAEDEVRFLMEVLIQRVH